MEHDNHYSLARAKRSLLHFGIGKAASAGFGIVVLVLTVRLLPATDYGIYIALLAFLEIFYIVSGFGLSTVAQRYVAEFRIKACAEQFRQFVSRIAVLRLLFAAFAALAVLALANPLLALLNVELNENAQGLFILLLIFGSCTRFLDEVFPALLLQAYTQGLLFMGNLLKTLVLGSATISGNSFGYPDLLMLELAVALLACLTGSLLLWRYLRIDLPAPEGAAKYDNRQMWPVALRFYAVQLIGQAYGPNVLKLLISRLMGLAQTATFGFLQALADMIRNYLPAYLLATWVRPLMVSRYVQRRDMGEVSAMANVVFKLSLIGVVPFAAFFSVHGDRFAAWVSSGKYVDAASVLTALMVLIALQSLHTVMSMVTVTVERAGGNVVATVICCVALPLAVWLSRYWGLAGVVAAMALAEGLWVGLVWAWLAKDGLRVSLDLRGAAKIVSAGLLAALVVKTVGGSLVEGWALMLVLLLTGLAVLSITALLKPFGANERTIIGRLIPARFFFW